MDDILDKLTDFFKAQKDLYGSELILNRKLSDELPEKKLPEEKTESAKEPTIDENLGQLKTFYHEI
ncbi:MAG: hypothetical protein KAS58_03845, partial [Calditrichia bacterium]|nr:hypothetical protein [Calditrichia bacterium]